MQPVMSTRVASSTNRVLITNFRVLINRVLINRVVTFSMIALLVTGTFAQNAHAQQTAPAQSTTGGWRYKPMVTETDIIGEVVDTWCYSSQVMGPGRGEKHKACGLACAHGGVTLGIVDDKDTLYIAAKHQGFQGCKDLLTPYIAKRVKAHGWVAHRGGCNIMKIKSVQELPADRPSAAAPKTGNAR